MSGLQITLIVSLVLPTLAIVLWPLFRGRAADAIATAEHPRDDRRLELEEEKTALYRALRELEFDHEAGHLSDADYEGLRERYETRAAALITDLDALGPAPAPRAKRAAAAAEPAPARTARRRRGSTPAGNSRVGGVSAWREPRLKQKCTGWTTRRVDADQNPAALDPVGTLRRRKGSVPCSPS